MGGGEVVEVKGETHSHSCPACFQAREVSQPLRYEGSGLTESGGRMWEISWNVRVFFFFLLVLVFLGFFFFLPPHTGATTALPPPPLFSALLRSLSSSTFSDVKELGEVHGGEIQSPEDCANALPQFLNVIMS